MRSILTINAGSSSVRFAQFSCASLQAAKLERVLDGKIERVQETDAALNAVLQRLSGRCAGSAPDAIGHRLVHGLKFREPLRITAALLDELKALSAIDPEHLPRELALIESFAKHFPEVPQVACFDTAFHAGMPKVARLLSIPRKWQRDGVERYGFHGLSYTYLMQELRRRDATLAAGRIVLAHLGGGASLAAVKDGHCLDTSMGFTPAAGLVMGTRSGDLDPGLLGYLARARGLSSADLERMVNHESGLLGLSERSADVRDLLANEADERAREALELFCYQARKWIGAYAAVLGGLDGLVFAGGVGENAAAIRARICAGLAFLGVRLDEKRNSDNNPDIISAHDAPVTVRVIRTDEEIVIAQATARLLNMHPD